MNVARPSIDKTVRPNELPDLKDLSLQQKT
jgi:hypothetical protein